MIRLAVADSRHLLDMARGSIPAIFTSLPDAAEVGGDVAAWRDIYRDLLERTFAAVAPDGVAIIAATDRRVDGGIESKAAMIHAAAAGYARPLWHKIATNVEGTSLFRPSYSHLIAFGTGRTTAGKASADVFPAGRKNYPNALGEAAIAVGLDLIERVGAEVVVDPFVGRGSILGAAADRNLGGIGVDIDPLQISAALDNLRPLAVRVDATLDLLVP